MHWEHKLTKCSVELMGILIIQYQKDMDQLDNELTTLNNAYDAVKIHTHFDSKYKELKDFLTKPNKDIAVKKQIKMIKDKMAFVEGFAYQSVIAPGVGDRPELGGPHPDSQPYTTSDEGTESDSSLSSFSQQQSHGLSQAGRGYNHTGVRKRTPNGGGYGTPHTSKRKQDNARPLQPPKTQQGGDGVPSTPANRNTHLSPLAAQALQILKPQGNTRPQLPIQTLNTQGRKFPNIPSLRFNTTGATIKKRFLLKLQSPGVAKQVTLDPFIIRRTTLDPLPDTLPTPILPS